MRKGILLVNLGTPNSPRVHDVRKFLAEFLMDKRVIDIHPFFRFLLVRGIIVPFRGPGSARMYKRIWNAKTGSPLLHYSNLQQQMLKIKMGDEYVVELGMRYQYPSIELALDKLIAAGADSIHVVPLFPQFASATTGSVMAEVMRVIGQWHFIPPVSISGAFYGHPLFVRAFASKAVRYSINSYDHVLFSFHGLPVRQLKACKPPGSHSLQCENCIKQITAQNKNCYAAQCHETARLIAQELNIAATGYTVCFQSRLGKQEWIKPYTSSVIQRLASQGKKRVLVICPSFVADCLETIHEIATAHREEFIAAGGEQLHLVESLNDSPAFITLLKSIVSQSVSDLADQSCLHIV